MHQGQCLEVKELIDANSPNIVKIEITDIRVRFHFQRLYANDSWQVTIHIEGDISLLGENAAPFHSFHVA